jgi:hypothetical protein
MSIPFVDPLKSPNLNSGILRKTATYYTVLTVLPALPAKLLLMKNNPPCYENKTFTILYGARRHAFL